MQTSPSASTCGAETARQSTAQLGGLGQLGEPSQSQVLLTLPLTLTLTLTLTLPLTLTL